MQHTNTQNKNPELKIAFAKGWIEEMEWEIEKFLFLEKDNAELQAYLNKILKDLKTLKEVLHG